MPFYSLKEQIARKVAASLNHPEVTWEQIFQEFTVPPNVAMGQLALPCFRLSKVLGKPAGKVVQELAAGLAKEDMVVTPAGPYANFKLPMNAVYTTVLNEIITKKDLYGGDLLGKGQRIVLEYCSPNIAKRLAFQHIRSTLIGNTLANVYDFLGYQTERMNFVGDWGSQFARLLASVELWGDTKKLLSESTPNADAMADLFELYVRFHKEVDKDPALLEKANTCLQKLEAQDPQSVKLWTRVRAVSVTAMDQTLARMNIRFNHIEGESKYISQIETTLEDVKKKAQGHLSDGAWIVDVERDLYPGTYPKRDGTTLYLTRDIAAAIERWDRFHFDKSLYVVSEQQKLHFQLLFGVLKKMGCDWASRAEHVSFGTVLFGANKMSTREGRVIFLDDLLNEARALALVECTKKNPDLANKEEVAEAVGIGAIIFGELSSHRQRDIEFDWKNILALDGETGPYVQYSHVRCHSLLAKAKEKGEVFGEIKPIPGYEFAPEEETLIMTLAKFRSTLIQITKENEPYYLTSYLIDVAKAFNRFYYQFPVLQATDLEQRQMRLNLVRGTQIVIANGLKLLGISIPQEM